MTIHRGFNFQQLGGFPHNQQRLETMQAAYAELSGALAGFVGDNVILSGCVASGNSISDGWIVVKGELLPFAASATAQTTFVIREVKTALRFKNTQDKEVLFSRFAQFGSGTGAIRWDSMKRAPSLAGITDHIANKDNPHGVTARHVGLGNIPNNVTDDATSNASHVLASTKMVQNRLSNVPNAKSDAVNLNNSNTLATSKAVNDKLNLLPNAKSDAVNSNNSNVLATSKAVNDKLSNLPNAKTDDPNVSDSNVLATSKAVFALNKVLATGRVPINKSSNNVRIDLPTVKAVDINSVLPYVNLQAIISTGFNSMGATDYISEIQVRASETNDGIYLTVIYKKDSLGNSDYYCLYTITKI